MSNDKTETGYTQSTYTVSINYPELDKKQLEAAAAALADITNDIIKGMSAEHVARILATATAVRADLVMPVKRVPYTALLPLPLSVQYPPPAGCFMFNYYWSADDV